MVFTEQFTLHETFKTSSKINNHATIFANVIQSAGACQLFGLVCLLPWWLHFQNWKWSPAIQTNREATESAHQEKPRMRIFDHNGDEVPTLEDLKPPSRQELVDRFAKTDQATEIR